MTVRAIDDVSLEVLDDPEHDQKYKGKRLYWPNSVRRDISFHWTLSQRDEFRDYTKVQA